MQWYVNEKVKDAAITHHLNRQASNIVGIIKPAVWTTFKLQLHGTQHCIKFDSFAMVKDIGKRGANINILIEHGWKRNAVTNGVRLNKKFTKVSWPICGKHNFCTFGNCLRKSFHKVFKHNCQRLGLIYLVLCNASQLGTKRRECWVNNRFDIRMK